MSTRGSWISRFAAAAAVALAGCARKETAHAERVPAASAAPAAPAIAPPAERWTASEFLRALPRGTVAYACARDLAAAYDAGTRTRLASILGDPKVGSLLSRLGRAIVEELSLEDAGPDALRSLAQARIELAVVDVDAPDPSWWRAPDFQPFDLAIAVTEAKGEVLWRKVLRSLWDRRVLSGGIAVSGFRVGAWEFLEIAGAGSSLVVGSSAKAWLLGTRRETIETIADRWGSTREDGLAGAPGFADVRGRMGRDPAIFLYADLQRAVSSAGIPAPVERVLEATGIGGLQAAAYGVDVADGIWRERIRFQTAQEPRGLLAALFPQGQGVASALRLIPAGALSASLQKIDPAGLWGSVERIVSSADPRAIQGFRQGLAAFEARFGISVERDIVGALGDALVSYATAGRNGGEEVVWAIALRDAGAFQRGIVGIANGVGLPAEPIEVASFPGLALPGGIGLPGIPGAPPGSAARPCLVFSPSHAVFATSPAAAQGFLDHVARGGPSVAERPEWKKLSSGIPMGGCAISFADLGAGARSLALGLAQGSSALGQARLPIDPNALPVEAAKEAGPALAVVASDPRGIGAEIASEVGLAPMGTAVILATAGSAIFQGIDGLSAKKEEGARELLRRLAAAQESYRAKRGSYARVLSELAREGLLPIDLADGVHRDYLIKIRVPGAGSPWEAHARPIDGRGPALACDASGNVRRTGERP